jgi:ATP-dependent DNA helicase RecQ
MNLQKTLQEYFGLETFRSPQDVIIEGILQGRDTLVIMPTGKGKSLCYQLPSLLLPGVTIVISPLIALMKDQVNGLLARNIPAACINSSMSSQEQYAVMDQLRRGEIKIVYIAPERFRNQGFLRAMEGINVSLMAVDEAHCLSQWGHDFRPDYLRLGKAIEILGRPTVAALTATATPDVRQDILDNLHLRDPALHISGFARPNLAFNIRSVSNMEEKYAHIEELIAKHQNGIIYCATRKSAERVSDYLHRAEIEHVLYHGGLAPEERDTMQNRFIQREVNIAVATNAFGMGIDRPDIRFVAHYEIPGSIEAYYQEAGRAGRDGQPSTCELYFNYADKRIQERFVEGSNPPIDVIHSVYELLREYADKSHEVRMSADDMRDRLGPGTNPMAVQTSLSILMRNQVIDRFDIPGERLRGTRLLHPDLAAHQLNIDTVALAQKSQRDHAKLNAVVKFAYSRGCHQRWVLDYFGDPAAKDCGECNGCVNNPIGDYREPASDEEKKLVLKALSGVARMSRKTFDGNYAPRFGKRRVIQMLLGDKEASNDWFDATELSTFGILKPEGKTYVNALFNAMEEEELIYVDESGDYPLLGLTTAGLDVMRGHSTFRLSWPAPKESRKKSKNRETSILEPSVSNLNIKGDLLQQLKSKRAQVAAMMGNIPPYKIFPNKVLQDLAIHRPQTKEEAMEINGIGEVSARKYYPHFQELLRK